MRELHGPARPAHAESHARPAARGGLPLAAPNIMKKIEAIIKPHRLDEVKERLRQVGVTGMTISDVKGFGRTGGQREVYRGSAYFVDLVPKVRIEIVVKDGMLRDTVAAISATARTGKIGDGKIFITSIDDAVRIRTAEHGEDAI
jgi:nitrogen regulatory protein P-II 1